MNDIDGAQINGKPLNTVPDELNAIATERGAALNDVITSGPKSMQSRPPSIDCAATPTLLTPSGGTATAVAATDPCFTAFNSLDATYNAFPAGLSTPNATTGQPALVLHPAGLSPPRSLRYCFQHRRCRRYPAGTKKPHPEPFLR